MTSFNNDDDLKAKKEIVSHSRHQFTSEPLQLSIEHFNRESMIDHA